MEKLAKNNDLVISSILGGMKNSLIRPILSFRDYDWQNNIVTPIINKVNPVQISVINKIEYVKKIES